MAINPLRFNPLDIPPNLPSGARAPEGTFSNLASIGDAIGDYRTRNRLSEVAQGAIDPQTGALDINKFATGAALAGIDPMRALAIAEAARGRTTSENAQRALEAYHARTAAEQERANRENERLRQLQIDQPGQTIVPPSLLNPGGAYTVPRDPTQPPVFRPFPTQSIPGPQSSLEPPAPNMAAVEPNPEEAPPYQVAGPPVASPQAQATTAPADPAAQPAATTARNEAYLRSLPPSGQEYIKALANYDIDPAKASKEELTAAKIYRPDYQMSEYQKRGSPVSGEVAGRTGLGKSFLDEYPEIKRRIGAGEATGAAGRASVYFGQGYPAELTNAIKEGAESLLRGLTGAGMNKDEAADYAARYNIRAIDTKETQLLKIRGLERALRYVITETGKGRGGDDLLKDYKSQFGSPLEQQEAPKVANERQASQLVGYAQEALKNKTHTYEYLLEDLRRRGVQRPELMLRRE